MLTLKEEIYSAGLEFTNYKIGLDNKYGGIIKESISIQELLTGRYKTLLSKKVKEVWHGNGENEYIFILNTKQERRA